MNQRARCALLNGQWLENGVNCSAHVHAFKSLSRSHMHLIVFKTVNSVHFLVSTYFLGIMGSKVVLSNNQSDATLWLSKHVSHHRSSSFDNHIDHSVIVPCHRTTRQFLSEVSHFLVSFQLRSQKCHCLRSVYIHVECIPHLRDQEMMLVGSSRRKSSINVFHIGAIF